MMSTPKVKDVAERAGVSTATVSRVLNNDSRVKAILQERVWRAVQELDYLPDYTARNLRARKTHNLGLVVPDIQNTFFTALARGIEDLAYENGYRVTLCNTDENLVKEQLYLQVLYGERMAGVIICPASETETDCSLLWRSKIPFVAIDRLLQKHKVDAVMIDNVLGAKLAMRHLLALGHRQIAIITTRLNVTTGRERLEGYYEALAEAGLSVDPALIKIGDHRSESGYAAIVQLLQEGSKFTAIFICNNVLTLGALKALQERQVQIPQQLSIVSFDDPEWARLIAPPLTCMAQPTYALGQAAAELLLLKIAASSSSTEPDLTQSPPPQLIVLKPTLVIRQSTAPL